MWYDLNICKDSWEKSLEKLVAKVNNKKINIKTRIRANALLVCADLIEKVQFVLLKTLWTCYSHECTEEYKSNKVAALPSFLFNASDARDLFQRHLRVIAINQNHEEGIHVFIVKKIAGVNWTELMEKFNWPMKTEITNANIADKLNGYVKPALKYASTERDRQMLKLLLIKLTSVNFLESGKMDGIKFNRKSLNNAKTITEANFQSSDKSEHTSSRLPGAGRPSFCSVYPNLTVIMLNLFDTCSEGLRSHPRLICDTLFLNAKESWMDMPRCCSILQQLYDIPIKLSTAYTYTQSFKAGTYQAKRHQHENTADISLHRSTRDANIDKSINSHFATSDVQYSLSDMYMKKGSIIARDNKAKVHCDCEVVQRPSKSWIKINYSDHDWQKSTDKTLTLTTYQFVNLTDVAKQEIIQSEICGIPVSRTRVTGPAVTIVKMSFFEPESCFRHFNELLYIMSLDKHKNHFMDETNFISQLLVTVDGGGDERPRNKSTHFLAAVLRWLLDLDKIKVISYAEHDSKLHSVERVHPAENRALSQKGIIPSNLVHDSDNDNVGLLDQSKMKENMEAAAKEAVNRLHGTPFAKDKLFACNAPSPETWVISPEMEKEMKRFLLKDQTEYRVLHNFTLKPKGPVWAKLCEMYCIDKNKAKTAIHLFNSCYEPGNSWQQHYAFSVYRPNDSWRGQKPIRRFEIQPIIDVGRLPEHHYLPFGQVQELVQHFENSNEALPLWLTSPDFYLPSRNLKFVWQNHPEKLEDCDFLKNLSDLIGISIEECKSYISDLENKKREKENYSELLKSYKGTFLGQLSVMELKNILERMGVKLTTKQTLKGGLLKLVDEQIKCRGLNLEDYL